MVKIISKKIFRLLLLPALSYVLLGCSTHGSSQSPDYNVILEIQCDSHIKTDSINPQQVINGNQACFHLIFDEGYTFYKATDGVFDEKTQNLIVDSKLGNRTVFVESINDSGFVVEIDNNEKYGFYTIEPKKNYYLDGEEIIISTFSKERQFLCYTFDLPYRNGLKKQSGIPISWDSKTAITVNSNIKICINYFETNKIVKYDLNGGITFNGQSTIISDCYLYTDDDYLFPNTINLSQYAYNSGYVLESFNTKIDGSGMRIGIGSRIDNNLFESNELILYAQWIKESDINYFEFEYEDNIAVITKCICKEKTIVIPRYINNIKVTKIVSNSFMNNDTTKRIVFPDTIISIEDFAFVNFNQTEEILIYSSVEMISKKSFDMPRLKRIRINKNTHSLNVNYEEDNLSRYKEAILNLNKNKTNVIFVGHSTTRINHDLTPLKSKWDDYNFFIYGASAGIHGSILLSSLLDIVRPQDYLIIPIWPILNLTTRRSLAFIQYDYDRLSDVDYSLIKDFIWESFVDFRQTCSKDVGVSSLLPEAINYCRWDQFGMNLENNPTSDPNNKSPYNYTNYLDSYNGESFAWLDAVLEKFNISKDHVILTWNAYNENNINDLSLYSAFEDRIRNYFSQYRFFDSQIDNIYPGNYFNKNDFMHLSTFGTKNRVERWAQQLPFNF